jgi:hypothetical protein
MYSHWSYRQNSCLCVQKVRPLRQAKATNVVPRFDFRCGGFCCLCSEPSATLPCETSQ